MSICANIAHTMKKEKEHPTTLNCIFIFPTDARTPSASVCTLVVSRLREVININLCSSTNTADMSVSLVTTYLAKITTTVERWRKATCGQ